MRGQAKAAAAKARIRKSAEERMKAAAIVAFANKGAHGTTIAEIAGSLNMPTATVHYYFKNKKDLYDAVLQQIVRLWFSKIADIEDGSDPLAEIEKYVRSKMEFSRHYPQASRIFAPSTEMLISSRSNFTPTTEVGFQANRRATAG